MPPIARKNRKLRTGVTTGACAAAAAKAACESLLANRQSEIVTVDTDRGVFLAVPISVIERKNGGVECTVVKDAGDDPDVTHGIEIKAFVTKLSAAEICISGGPGVGRVTKPGLKIPVGRAAINPAPLRMIRREAENLCRETGYPGGLDIVISVPKGENVAEKTLNERLGIVGGISILGTTGIVEPMSEKALIDTLKTEIDMRVAEGAKTLFVTPGNYGLDFARSEPGFDRERAIKCANHIGEVLDYARYLAIEKVVLLGHAGKLIKLAGGIMNTHSSVADARMEIFAAHAAMHGASAATVRAIMDAVTVEAAMASIDDKLLLQRTWESIGREIAFHLEHRTKGRPVVEFIVFTFEDGVLIRSSSGAARGDNS